MTIDISHLSIDELIAKAMDARQALIDAKRADLMAELKQLAQLEQPSGPSAANAAPSKIANNYKGYTDGKGDYWTGRGRRPQWFLEIQEFGANLAAYERNRE